MVISGRWAWQEGLKYGAPLAETANAGAEPWPPRRTTSVCAPNSCSSRYGDGMGECIEISTDDLVVLCSSLAMAQEFSSS